MTGSERRGRLWNPDINTPYGYMRSPQDRHKLVVDETAAKIVKQMFSLFSAGDSARHISSLLNAEGVLCPRAHYYSQAGQIASVKNNIRTNARLAADKEDKLIQRRVKLSNKEQERESTLVRDKMQSASKHVNDINTFMRKLFEEKCAGNMPDSIFKKMLFDQEKKLESYDNA